MKKFVLLMLLPLLCACSGGNKEKTEDSTVITSVPTTQPSKDLTEDFKQLVSEHEKEFITFLVEGYKATKGNKERMIEVLSEGGKYDKKTMRELVDKYWSQVVAQATDSITVGVAVSAPQEQAPAPQEQYGYGAIGEDGRPDPSGVYLITDKEGSRFVMTINKDKTAQLCREENYGKGKGIVYGSYTKLNFLDYWPMFHFDIFDLRENAPIVFVDGQGRNQYNMMTLREGKLYTDNQSAKAKDPTKAVSITRYK